MMYTRGVTFSCAPQMRHYHEKLNFLLEGVRCGLDKEIAPDETYLTYFSFGAMIERPKIAPYHKKLLNCDSINLNTCAHRQCSYLIADTCRLVASEELSVNSVHCCEVSDVGKKNRSLSYVVKRVTCLLEDLTKVCECLTSLCLNALSHYTCSTVDRELT